MKTSPPRAAFVLGLLCLGGCGLVACAPDASVDRNSSPHNSTATPGEGPLDVSPIDQPTVTYQPAYPPEVATEGLTPQDTAQQRTLAGTEHVDEHEGAHDHPPGETHEHAGADAGVGDEGDGRAPHSP